MGSSDDALSSAPPAWVDDGEVEVCEGERSLEERNKIGFANAIDIDTQR